MKEEQMGKITQGELRQLSREVMEQMETRTTNDFGSGSRENLETGYASGSDGRTSPIGSLGAAREQALDAATMMEGTGQLSVDGVVGQPSSGAATSEHDSSQPTMEKWALDNAPPPIKVRQEGEESSPEDLSPPPSPKRVRELARKDNIHDLPVRTVFSHGSI